MGKDLKTNYFKKSSEYESRILMLEMPYNKFKEKLKNI